MAYGTDQGLENYLAQSGRVLPAGMTPAVARNRGSAYVNLFEDKYLSKPISPPDSFPRVAYDPVPLAVEYAAYEAAFAVASGLDLFGTGGTAGGQVVREKIDVLEVQYAEPQAGFAGYWDNNRFILPLAYALLLPFMRKAGFGPAAFVVGGCGKGC